MPSNRDLGFGSGPGEIVAQGTHKVYTRENWGDSFFELENAHCLEMTYSVAPTMPTAMILVRYGSIAQIGSGEFVRVDKTTATELVGHFVKIELNCREAETGWQKRYWYGQIMFVEDQQGGEVAGDPRVAQGSAKLSCYGMEIVLANSAILDSVIVDTDTLERVFHPTTFNEVPGKPGITGNRYNGEFWVGFAGRDNQQSATWSSYDIVEYLLIWQTARDRLGQRQIRFRLRAPIGTPPKWDTPVINPKGQTVYSVLSQLIDRRRMMVWWVEVLEQVGEPDICEIKVNTLTDTVIPVGIPDADPIPANSTRLKLVNAGADQLTTVAIRDAGLAKYHQVMVTGPRGQHVGTFSRADSNVDKGWTSSEESDYENGASSAADYSSQSRKEKQRRNAEARRDPKLQRVFAQFTIPDDWDFRVKDGENGVASVPMFLDPIADDVDPQWLSQLFIDPQLPLLTGVPYNGDIIRDDQIDESLNNGRERMRTLVCFQRRDRSKQDENDSRDRRWVRAEDLGAQADAERTGPDLDKQNERISVYVEVPTKSRTVVLKVSGGPQHAIAATDFGGLADDEKLGQLDYEAMTITLAMTATNPTYVFEPQVAPDVDAVRVKVIYAGDQYRRDYVAPNTVVSIDADTGQLQRSSGGYIPAEGSDADPIPQLRAIGKIAAKWYTETHYIAGINSYRLMTADEIRVGDMVFEFDSGSVGAPGHNQEVKTVVSQMRFSIPVGTPNAPAPQILMSVTTWAGELDAVGVTPFIPGGGPDRRDRPFPDRAAPPQPFVGDLLELGPDGTFVIPDRNQAEFRRRQSELQQNTNPLGFPRLPRN